MNFERPISNEQRGKMREEALDAIRKGDAVPLPNFLIEDTEAREAFGLTRRNINTLKEMLLAIEDPSERTELLNACKEDLEGFVDTVYMQITEETSDTPHKPLRGMVTNFSAPLIPMLKEIYSAVHAYTFTNGSEATKAQRLDALEELRVQMSEWIASTSESIDNTK